MDCSLNYYIVFSLTLFIVFVLKSILFDMSIATPAFFFCTIAWIFFIPSLSVCVDLMFQSGSLVDTYMWTLFSYPLSYLMYFDWII